MLVPYLMMVRATIIAWVTLAVIPFEIAHETIDVELRRQGIE